MVIKSHIRRDHFKDLPYNEAIELAELLKPNGDILTF